MKRLGRGDGGEEQERAAFLGLCGHIMKRLLQHHARPLYRQREKVSLSEGLCADGANPEILQEVEGGLARLAAINPKLRAVVEMRVFEGLTGDEIAERLGCSRRSATVYWGVAKNWLQTEWAEGGPNDNRPALIRPPEVTQCLLASPKTIGDGFLNCPKLLPACHSQAASGSWNPRMSVPKS